MSVSFNRNTAFQIISNEKMGFQFGVPERPDANSLAVVLPILRTTAVKRNYITLPETDKVDIADTGSINKMRFTNKSDDLVFVRSGTMLKGGTQERAVIRSAILFPGTTKDLEVRCIHQTRGISPNAKVTYGGITPLSFNQQSYRASYTARSQSDFWANASVYNMSVSKTASSRRLGRSVGASPWQGVWAPESHSMVSESLGDFVEDSALSIPFVKNDDLAANFDEFSKSFADLLAKVKLNKNQVGLGLISDKGVETIELFDLKQSWKAMHEDAVKSVGSDVAKTDDTGVFEYRQDKAIEAVKKVLGVGFEYKVLYEHRPSNGEPSVAVIGLSNTLYTGEIVELDQRVIHATILRMTNA